MIDGAGGIRPFGLPRQLADGVKPTSGPATSGCGAGRSGAERGGAGRSGAERCCDALRLPPVATTAILPRSAGIVIGDRED